MDQSDVPMLPNCVIKDALTDIIKKTIKTDDYTIQIEHGSSKGDNFIGILYRVKVKSPHITLSRNGNLKDDNENQMDNEISIILKLPPQNAIRRRQFFARSTFLREALVYNEILPMLIDFQKSRGIDLNKDGFNHIPKCLGTITDDGYEAIFLEDLRPKQFQMFNRLEKITFDHVKMVVTILGKLHAISYAMKDQCPEKMAQYKTIPEIFSERENDEALKGYFDSLKNRALEAMCPETDKTTIDKINKLFEGKNLLDIALNVTSGNEAEPYAVLCHGDTWNNNILFKYENGHPVEARLIDWQITRYASPVTDLTYYIFSCTTKDFRDAHYKEVMDIYHEELSTLLKKLGSDPEKLFPRHALDDQLKRFGKWGLLMAMMLLPIITSNADDIPDLDELSEQLDAGNLDTETTFRPEKTFKIYQNRIRGVAIDIDRLGYI